MDKKWAASSNVVVQLLKIKQVNREKVHNMILDDRRSKVYPTLHMEKQFIMRKLRGAAFGKT